MAYPASKTMNLYGLLIGIDCYLANQLPNGKRYPSLNGCVRDITLVEEFLLSRLRVPQECILKLKASNMGTTKPLEPLEELPTYENMVAAFEKLTQIAYPGDQVYIHYSGHGGRIPTKFPQLKTNGLDEVLVPVDIGNPKARCLRDVELAYILKRMVDKGLIVTIVLDSCHSGGATRGEGGATVRGLDRDTVDTTLRPTQSLVATDEGLVEAWQSFLSGSQRNLTLGNGWLPEPKGYVLLAACRPSESAYEYQFDDQGKNGALSYWLMYSLKQMTPNTTYKLLHDQIVAKIHSKFPEQTPLVQGESSRVAFGSDRIPSVYAVNVMQVDLKNKRVLLNTGQSQAARCGSQFAIYPPGVTDLSQVNQRLALVEITDFPGATSSWATIKDTFHSAPIEQGAQAVLLDPGTMRLRSTVHLVYQEQNILPQTIDQHTTLEKVKKALTQDGSSFVVLAADDEPVSYQVAINTSGEYEIWDAAGKIIPNLRPALRIDSEGAAACLVQRLVHLTKYHNVLRLDNADSLSPLKGRLELELLKAQPDFQPGDPARPQPFEDPGNIHEIQVGEWMFARIKNAYLKVLNITVLCLNSRWGITQLYPRTEDSTFLSFDFGEQHFLPLRAKLPDGYIKGTDIIKVFATVGATQFRWLELPALDEPPQEANFRSSHEPNNSLEEFLAAMGAVELGERQADFDLHLANWEWVTQQREVIIKTELVN
jgi:Caspase domain